MSRYLIILNPIAGAGKSMKALPRIKELLSRYGLSYDITLTKYPGHAVEIACQAAENGYDYVISAGGDGTSNEVLNGLMQYGNTRGISPVMGVLPVGRGNDFAYGAGIPVDVDEACALLTSLPMRWIDVGRVSVDDQPNGLYFGNGVGIGFDAVVGFLASSMKMKGMLSYLVAAIKTVFIYYKTPIATVQYGMDSFTLPALMVSIMNGRRMGGGFMMAPSAIIYDGLFNICIVRNVPQLAIFGLILKFMKGTHLTDPAVLIGQSNQVIVTALKGSLPVHADGNPVCEAGQKITVELIPHALQLITSLQS